VLGELELRPCVSWLVDRHHCRESRQRPLPFDVVPETLHEVWFRDPPAVHSSLSCICPCRCAFRSRICIDPVIAIIVVSREGETSRHLHLQYIAAKSALMLSLGKFTTISCLCSRRHGACPQSMLSGAKAPLSTPVFVVDENLCRDLLLQVEKCQNVTPSESAWPLLHDAPAMLMETRFDTLIPLFITCFDVVKPAAAACMPVLAKRRSNGFLVDNYGI